MVGTALRDRFREGERFALQPAVDHPPVNHRECYQSVESVKKLGVGYTLPGLLAEYVLLTEEAIRAGCLLPIPEGLSYAHAALGEPLSCVVSAQEHHVHLIQETPHAERKVRKGLKPGGVTLIIGAGAMGRMHVDLALAQGPRAVVVSDLIDARLLKTRELFEARARALGIGLHTVSSSTQDVKQLIDALSDHRSADDIIVAVGSAAAIEAAQRYAGRGAVLNLFGGLKKGEDTVALDTGLVHYKEIAVTGSSGGSPWDLERALEFIAAGKIDAGAHITRIGDLGHAKAFLEMVRAQEIDGKAVVYPHRRTDEIYTVTSWSAEDERLYLEGHR
jgi:L-iditol 2-dehydrogenase